MATIEESVDVNVPLSTAYNQWTQFEDFPSFMEGVEAVRQLDDTHLHWVVAHHGHRHEFDAVVTEQRPDERIAWKATDGTPNAGVVTFEPIDAERCRVTVRMDWQPEGAVESVGAAIGSDDRRVKDDMHRFKELIEQRGTETGGWRGEVNG
jgi:uncharacterized membrane protein